MKKKYYLYLLPVLIILLFPVYYYGIYNRNNRQTDAVAVDKATIRNIERYLSCNGQVDPYATITLRLSALETVTAIFRHSGEAVKKGQLLLTTNIKEYRSPLDGYLLKGPLSPAEGTGTGGKEPYVLVLSSLDSLVFSGNIAEFDLFQVMPGLSVAISPSIAYKDGFISTISAVEGAGTTKNSIIYFRICAYIGNAEHRITKTGFTATAKIITASKNNVLTVKEEFVTEENQSKYVYIASGDNPLKFNKKIITTGVSDGIYTEITSGLSSGDKIYLPKLLE